MVEVLQNSNFWLDLKDWLRTALEEGFLDNFDGGVLTVLDVPGQVNLGSIAFAKALDYLVLVVEYGLRFLTLHLGG